MSSNCCLFLRMALNLLFLLDLRLCFFQKHFFICGFILCRILSWYLEMYKTSLADTSERHEPLKVILFWWCDLLALFFAASSNGGKKKTLCFPNVSDRQRNAFYAQQFLTFHQDGTGQVLGLVQLFMLSLSNQIVKGCLKQSIQLYFINYCVTELSSCN